MVLVWELTYNSCSIINVLSLALCIILLVSVLKFTSRLIDVPRCLYTSTPSIAASLILIDGGTGSSRCLQERSFLIFLVLIISLFSVHHVEMLGISRSSGDSNFCEINYNFAVFYHDSTRIEKYRNQNWRPVGLSTVTHSKLKHARTPRWYQRLLRWCRSQITWITYISGLRCLFWTRRAI